MDSRPASFRPDPIEAEHRKRLMPWAVKAVDLVRGKIEDARAHAENAVTASLVGTPDGKPSLLKLRANRSYAASLARLDELWAAIGGPSVTSTSGFVHDATAAFYEDSRRLWWDRADPDFRVTGREPTTAQLAYVRSLLWFGLPVRQGFEAQMATTRTALTSALSMAGSMSFAAFGRGSALATWEQQSIARLIARLGLALFDANQRADDQANLDSHRPEFLDAL